MASKTKGSKFSRPKSLTYVHEKYNKVMVGDVPTIIQEKVWDGPKGVSFRYYHKDKKGNTLIVNGKQEEGGKFTVVVKENSELKTEKKDMTKTELLAMLKKIKELKFAEEYLAKSKQSGGYYRLQTGGKRRSRKGSRKGSKKGYRKGSRKGSKKGSRKGSKKGSRKGSRKSTKGSRKSKRSKKASKKKSRKASRKRSRKY